MTRKEGKKKSATRIEKKRKIERGKKRRLEKSKEKAKKIGMM